MRKGIRAFLTAEFSTLGLTTIRPGIHVDLKGLYAPFDGIWYVTQTVHTVNAAGYITRTSLRRPGMLDPAGYPGGAA
jgi:phage protein D